jgi:hypothetical protein
LGAEEGSKRDTCPETRPCYVLQRSDDLIFAFFGSSFVAPDRRFLDFYEVENA